MFFSIVARSDVFFRPRDIIDYASKAPPLPRWFSGNWHYGFAPRPEPPSYLQVVTMPPPANPDPNRLRLDLADFLAAAKAHGAIGVALDYYFRVPAPDADPVLCAFVNGWPNGVVGGVRHTASADGNVTVDQIPSTLQSCFHDESIAHLSVIQDPDNVVRMVPIELPGSPTFTALSFRIATRLSKEVSNRTLFVPDNRVIEFVPPLNTRPITLDRLASNGWPVNGKYILLGRDIDKDRYETPFGKHLGVEIHSYAVQALLGEGAIHRPTWGWTVPTIALSCYVIEMLVAARRRWRTILTVAAALSIAIIGSAIVAMRFALVWLEVEVPLIALWLMTGLAAAAGQFSRATVVALIRRKRGAAEMPAAN
jgi:CHASE2 domain-containing sensor protein